MGTLWEIGLANALVVAVVAPLAFVAARATKRPAWAHAIWVVVLLKLVTPPVARWPVARAWGESVQELPVAKGSRPPVRAIRRRPPPSRRPHP